MLKPLQYAVVMLIVLFGLWIFGTSSSFKTCKAEQTTHNAEQRKENPPKFALAVTDSIAIRARCALHVVYEYRDAATALATVLIAFFTFTLWRSTDRLWKSADRQRIDSLRSIDAAIKSADVAEKAMLVANRPVITIEPLVLSSPTEFFSATHILFGLKNSGHGAAVINRLDANIETLVPGALTLRTNSGLIGTEINGTIEPHQTMPDLRLTSEVLTVDELPKIFAGNVTLEVTIQITAHDIIDNPYNPTFAFVYDHRGHVFVRRGLTPEHNPRTNS